jgi:Fe-Mn family superoxide dismutase
MGFELSKLPFKPGALAPHIGQDTVTTHYEKHHGGYVQKLNAAVEGSLDEKKSLEELIRTAGGTRFNLAAQVWNHDFYWRSLHPQGGNDPRGELAEAITETFGSVDELKQRLTHAANTEFGSGWAWLVTNGDGELAIYSTTDAENPLLNGDTPLLTIDVWEHAYYLDYRNERARYVDACIEHLLNWEHAEQEYQRYLSESAQPA